MATFSALHHSPTLQSNIQIATNDQPSIRPKICVSSNIRNMADANHSNENLVELNVIFDLDRRRLPIKDTNEFQIESERRCTFIIEDSDRCGLHKKEDEYGNEAIVSERVGVAVYGSPRQAADFEFKCVRDDHECMNAVRRRGAIASVVSTWLALLASAGGSSAGPAIATRVLAVVGVCLSMLATAAATPIGHSRPMRSLDQGDEARNYLQRFGYLRAGELEVGNLQLAGADPDPDLRVAIRTLQEFGGIPVTGVIDEATKHLMKQKRCGMPDRDPELEFRHRRKRFTLHGDKWKHTNLTWSLSSVRRSAQLDPYHTRDVLRKALDVWQQASRLTFTEINSDQADIVVLFAKRHHDDSYPFDGRGSILAHAFFPGTGRGGDAHFDDDELWFLTPKNDNEEGTSLFAVAVHEFGHSLGLSHSSQRGALMYPWYQGIQPNFVLPEDDRNGIQQLYGPKDTRKRTWGEIPHRRVETPTPPTTTTSTTTSRPNTYYPQTGHRERHPYHSPDQNYPRIPNRFTPTRYTPDHPRWTHHHHTTERTTTQPTTYRPRYPYGKPEYPVKPRPYIPNQDYPRKKTTHYPPQPTPPSDKPDTCNTSYDAIALIRGEIFIFKNRYHWRIGNRGRYPDYPIEITRMWSKLPKDLTHVDAVYERPDRKIAFFIGRKLYLFDSQTLEYGYPKPLEDLGLPPSLDKIDAAMVWGYNEKTYFYSGTMYWKFDEETGKVEPDYPRDMSMWKGVGYNIDSVFKWKDGRTYFFKGKGYWEFNDLKMSVVHERQQSSAVKWMGCPPDRIGRRYPYSMPQAPGSTLRSPSAAAMHINNKLAFLSSVILVLLRSLRYF